MSLRPFHTATNCKECCSKAELFEKSLELLNCWSGQLSESAIWNIFPTEEPQAAFVNFCLYKDACMDHLHQTGLANFPQHFVSMLELVCKNYEKLSTIALKTAAKFLKFTEEEHPLIRKHISVLMAQMTRGFLIKTSPFAGNSSEYLHNSWQFMELKNTIERNYAAFKLLWIAKYKNEDNSLCLLAKLPKEIIAQIAREFVQQIKFEAANRKRRREEY